MEIIGNYQEDFAVQKMELKPVHINRSLQGSVISIDVYGNVITNISREEFNKHNINNSFSILFGRENEKINSISEKYKSVMSSEKLALFGENNLLQIAINQGRANKLLGLKIHESIRIEFHD